MKHFPNSFLIQAFSRTLAAFCRHSLPANDGVKVRRHESSMLAEENQDLEKKLRQLREAMQKEMQKRDEVRRALTAGAIWSSARVRGQLTMANARG
jgi:hypothetical protein